jgi:predicted DNA-binding transcriptional regulator AlpA
MAITYTNTPKHISNNAAQAAIKPTKIGHSKALPVTVDLQNIGRLRIGHLMTLFSISHSTLYNRIKAGLIPKPDGTDGSRPFWNTSTIKAALEK